MTTDDQTYAFKNALDAQRARLRTLETLFDPGTIRYLEARGVAPGWRCAKVGAGRGSIAAWLYDRVGPEGSVLATDLGSNGSLPAKVQRCSFSQTTAVPSD
jgi:hypothetical protein